MREIFEIVNEGSEVGKYKVVQLDNVHPPSNSSAYTPYRVSKSVCQLVSKGARIMVSLQLLR